MQLGQHKKPHELNFTKLSVCSIHLRNLRIKMQLSRGLLDG